MELVRNTEDESGRFADPTAGLSVGARYLFDNVLIPLMNGAEVNTGSLDMDRFDREDIGTIFDFYTDNYTGYSQEFSRLCWEYWRSKKSATTTPVLLLVNRCTVMISQLSAMTPWVMLPTVSVPMWMIATLISRNFVFPAWRNFTAFAGNTAGETAFLSRTIHMSGKRPIL